MTIKIHNPKASDLEGFVNILTKNGYKVTFRKGGRLNLMADIESESAVILNERWEKAMLEILALTEGSKPELVRNVDVLEIMEKYSKGIEK